MLDKKDQLLVDLINHLEGKMPVKFFYRQSWIEGIKVDSVNSKMTLGFVLQNSLKGTEIDFKVIQNHYVVLVKDPTQLIEKDKILSDATNQGKQIKRITIGERQVRKSKVILQGKIVDFKNQTPIEGVNIVVDNRTQSAVTDKSGSYKLTIASGSHVILFSSFNYEDQYVDLDIFQDSNQDITLGQPPVLLEEVTVLDEASKNISAGGIGISTIKIQDLKKMPTFLGEVDVIKQIQTQAGVTTVGEVATGYNVRGGGVDQNLVLLDGNPIFNVSHVFGLLTAFNSGTVKSINFYKGGIPSEFGGRVSSVLKVITREVDNTNWHGGGGIGLLTSYLSLWRPDSKR